MFNLENRTMEFYKNFAIYFTFCLLISSPFIATLFLCQLSGEGSVFNIVSKYGFRDVLLVLAAFSIFGLPVVIQIVSIFVYRIVQFRRYYLLKKGAQHWKLEEAEKTYAYYDEMSYISENSKRYEMLDDRGCFEVWAFNVKSPMGTLLIGGPEYTQEGQERPVGAVAYLDAQTVLNNHWSIKSERLRRDNLKRSEAVVPGFNDVSKRDSQVVNGEFIYLWHRTHLIPYRHTMSEGNDIPNLLFAGTSHLNSGDRPQIGYEVRNDNRGKHSREKRKRNLIKHFKCCYPIKNYDTAIAIYNEGKSVYDELYSNLKNPCSIYVNGAPKGSYYSLADVEEAIDTIIEKNKQNSYAYVVFCNYKDDTDVVPDSITAMLINHTEGSVDFYIKLPNIF